MLGNLEQVKQNCLGILKGTYCCMSMESIEVLLHG